ncbi:MAG: MOSC domain-containing protein [Candidatus Acidiferrales bacterium]
MAALGSLASLHRYPVKSMMGEALNAAQVTPRGLFGDRSYALCDAETGKVVSAKNPRKWPNLFSYHAAFTSPPAAGTTVPPVRVTLPDGGFAVSSSPEFAPTLSAALGRSVTLLATPPQYAQLEEYWPDREAMASPDVVTDEAMPEGTFFDLAILHVLTTGTLDRLRELNPRSRFEPRRFRPNLIIDTGGQEGFVENDWIGKTISIGPEVKIQVTGPCPRCVMTTLGQADLPKDPQVLKTAAQHNEAHVGAYASVVQPGTIRIGDTLTIA